MNAVVVAHLGCAALTLGAATSQVVTGRWGWAAAFLMATTLWLVAARAHHRRSEART